MLLFLVFINHVNNSRILFTQDIDNWYTTTLIMKMRRNQWTKQKNQTKISHEQSTETQKYNNNEQDIAFLLENVNFLMNSILSGKRTCT